jgi:hypothetical protein
MVALSLEIVGADKLAAGMGKAAGRVLPSETKRAMEASLLLIEGDARRGVKRDTGRLQNSITHRISGGGGNLTGEVGPSVKYGLYVERGRRPGSPPPVSAVSAWARRHGVSPFLVARAIGRRGVKAAPFLLPAYEKNRNRIAEAFAKVGVKVVEAARG